MTVYKSKIDTWLACLVFLPLIYPVVESIRTNEYEPLYIMVPVLLFVLYIFTQIKYIIDNAGVLHVKAGVIVNQKVPVKDIKSVTKTYNPLSAPALSINRLEIKYGNNYNYVLISPKERAAFINQLVLLNPNIIVKL
jgi:uncharacterized membrane protein YdbT with pleckstrin-like domain